MGIKIRIGLSAKAVTLMVGLAAVPLMTVGVQILRLNRESLQYEVLRYHSHMAQALSEKLDGQLAALEERLRFVLASLESNILGWREKQATLQTLANSSPSFAIIAVVTQDGNEFMKVYNPERESALAAFPTLSSHAKNPLFKSFTRSQKRVMDIVDEGDDPRLVIYFPFQTPTGRHAIYLNCSLDAFWQEIAGTKIGKTGFAFLVDKGGLVLAHPEKERALQHASAKSMPIVVSALAGNVGASEYADRGTRWVGASAPVRRLGGAVITVQLRSEAYEAARRGQRTALWWILWSALLAGLAAWLFARRLVRPILSLTHAAQSVNLEAGRFPAPLVLKTRDELNELVQTFNAMTDQLKTYAAMQVEKLLSEKTKTEAIVFSINDGLIMTDHQGLVEFINNRARQILNITGDYQSILKKPLLDFLPRNEIMDSLWDIAQSRAEKQAPRELDVSASGYSQVFKVYSESVRTTKGEDIGVVIILHDITLEKELERMKEDFLHSITHDLRNPMTSIRGFLKFLIDGLAGPLSEQQSKIVATMDRASTRLLGMINDILDVAKLEAGKMELHLELTDLVDTGRRVFELLESQAQKKNITFVLQTPGVLKVNADPLLMERLLTNLTGNAIKFTPEGGRITLELADEPDRVSGAVVDTGEGIPPEYLGKIFQKFQQVTGQRKGGTGLGLTICRYIVEAHGGQIDVQSQLGKGARFHFWIRKDLADGLPPKSGNAG